MTDEPTTSPWHARYTSVDSGSSIEDLSKTETFGVLSSMVIALMDEFAEIGVVLEIKVDHPDDLADWVKMRMERLAMFPPQKRLGFIES